MANYPTSPMYSADFEGGIFYRTEITDFGTNTEQRNKKNSVGLRRWTLNYANITYTELGTLRTFFSARFGRYESFTFTDPRDSTGYTCRFDQDDFPEPTTNGVTYNLSLKIVQVAA